MGCMEEKEVEMKLLNLFVAASIGLSSLGFAQSRDDLIKRIRNKYQESYELRVNRALDNDFLKTVREDSLNYTLVLESRAFKDNYKRIIPIRLKQYGEMIREKQESIDSLTTIIEINFDIDVQADSLIDFIREYIQPELKERLTQYRDLDRKIIEREIIIGELSRLRGIMNEKDDFYLRETFNFLERRIKGKYR